MAKTAAARKRRVFLVDAIASCVEAWLKLGLRTTAELVRYAIRWCLDSGSQVELAGVD